MLYTACMLDNTCTHLHVGWSLNFIANCNKHADLSFSLGFWNLVVKDIGLFIVFTFKSPIYRRDTSPMAECIRTYRMHIGHSENSATSEHDNFTSTAPSIEAGLLGLSLCLSNKHFWIQPGSVGYWWLQAYTLDETKVPLMWSSWVDTNIKLYGPTCMVWR